jgi:acetyl esterase/lipase
MTIKWMLVAVGALTAFSASCGSDATNSRPVLADLSEPVARDVTYGGATANGYSSEPTIDVWAAPGIDDAPVLILLDGLPPSKFNTEEMAIALANLGFVVLNADWQADLTLATGGGFQAACLVRFARANANDFGGNAQNVGVVGYSAGGSFAAILALNRDAIKGQCEQDESLSSVPEHIIGLAGGYEYLVLESVEPGIADGVFAQDPDRWEMMNPYEHLDTADDVRALLIHGGLDTTVSPGSTERFASVLEQRGADVTTHILPDVGHSLTRGTTLESIVEHINTWMHRD